MGLFSFVANAFKKLLALNIEVSVPITSTGFTNPSILSDTLFYDRTDFTNKTTIGPLIIDGIETYFMLEPTCRPQPGVKLAIPSGKYEIDMYDSPHFGHLVPILKDVPGHDHVEIHPGNCIKDTHDCLCPGMTKSVDWVNRSEEAWRGLVTRIIHKKTLGNVYIHILGGINDA